MRTLCAHKITRLTNRPGPQRMPGAYTFAAAALGHCTGCPSLGNTGHPSKNRVSAPRPGAAAHIIEALQQRACPLLTGFPVGTRDRWCPPLPGSFMPEPVLPSRSHSWHSGWDKSSSLTSQASKALGLASSLHTLHAMGHSLLHGAVLCLVGL